MVFLPPVLCFFLTCVTVWADNNLQTGSMSIVEWTFLLGSWITSSIALLCFCSPLAIRSYDLVPRAIAGLGLLFVLLYVVNYLFTWNHHWNDKSLLFGGLSAIVGVAICIWFSVLLSSHVENSYRLQEWEYVGPYSLATVVILPVGMAIAGFDIIRPGFLLIVIFLGVVLRWVVVSNDTIQAKFAVAEKREAERKQREYEMSPAGRKERREREEAQRRESERQRQLELQNAEAKRLAEKARVLEQQKQIRDQEMEADRQRKAELRRQQKEVQEARRQEQEARRMRQLESLRAEQEALKDEIDIINTELDLLAKSNLPEELVEEESVRLNRIRQGLMNKMVSIKRQFSETWDAELVE